MGNTPAVAVSVILCAAIGLCGKGGTGMALQRETVVREALALLDEVGLEGLTMRRLAARLGVQNPALYWHFKNKQALLNLMAATLLADARAAHDPATHGADWAAFLT